MYKSIKSKVYLLIIFCVTACYPNSVGEPASLSPSPLETGIASTPVQNKTTIPTVDTVDIKPTATITPTPKTESSPITTPSQTNEPETELVNIGECPKQVASDTQPFWSTGSILFGTGQLLQFDYPYPYNPQSPGIWAVSSSNLEPQLAYGIPEDSSSWVIVSDDGNTLLRFEYTNEDRTEEEVIFYDLEGQTETRLQIVTEEAWDFEWLPDGQVKILTDVERIWGEGIKREFILLDLVSEQSEILIENLSLPGYIFNDEVIPGGFASISPSDNLMLYTALANDEVKVRLLDLITEDIIWEEESRVLPGPPPPVWTADGSRVLFYIGDRINEKRFGFDRIVNLGKDGQEVQLPFQPYPSTDEFVLDLLEWSQNQQYIVYGTKREQNGVGFLLDTSAWQVGQICDSEATFFDGQWITNELFVYLALIEKEGQTAYSLRILDVTRWEYQEIFQSEPGYGINLFGWTNFEFD